ncbi:hypothetical protein CEXT_452131 [Caerostris extrusa]|uniref:Uncharacterized protein n=1 Tax=Caerostris extrusa TaxID=172846 RepID=A0AAV4T1T8_CAEEX|nr:hypothetical protein CEXT_452131 [Caerostris extrusa]
MPNRSENRGDKLVGPEVSGNALQAYIQKYSGLQPIALGCDWLQRPHSPQQVNKRIGRQYSCMRLDLGLLGTVDPNPSLKIHKVSKNDSVASQSENNREANPIAQKLKGNRCDFEKTQSRPHNSEMHLNRRRLLAVSSDFDEAVSRLPGAGVVFVGRARRNNTWHARTLSESKTLKELFASHSCLREDGVIVLLSQRDVLLGQQDIGECCEILSRVDSYDRNSATEFWNGILLNFRQLLPFRKGGEKQC